MAELTIEQAKRIYRIAVDATMSDDQGADWWDKVVTEMRQVCAARSVKEGAAVIDWWHHDWSSVGDSANAAAQRIRQAARAV